MQIKRFEPTRAGNLDQGIGTDAFVRADATYNGANQVNRKERFSPCEFNFRWSAGSSSMKIAIPIWEDRVSPVLDAASRRLIVEIVNQRETSRFETYFEGQGLPDKCVRIRGLGIRTLVCGAVSTSFSKILEDSGINIISGISGHPEAVLDAYLHGNLCHSTFLMPAFHRNRAC